MKWGSFRYLRDENDTEGVPIDKALTDNVLIAFEMNGTELPRLNGAPLRLVVPGWPGSCSTAACARVTAWP